MATVVYKNAVVMIDGYDFSADFYELALEYSAEMLDETAFGDDTRVHRGGLLTATITGAAWADYANGIGSAANVLFDDNGTDDIVVALFPNGVTEGTSTDKGYAMKGVLAEFSLGDQVGTLLKVSLNVQSRGLEA